MNDARYYMTLVKAPPEAWADENWINPPRVPTVGEHFVFRVVAVETVDGNPQVALALQKVEL